MTKVLKFFSAVFELITGVLSYPIFSISLIIVVAFIILITVLKKKNVKYSTLDIMGIILNIVLSVGYTVLSCFSLIATLSAAISYRDPDTPKLLIICESFIILLIAVIPFVCIASLVHSANLRSTGFKKKSFLVQFAPIGWLGIIMMLGGILSLIAKIFT